MKRKELSKSQLLLKLASYCAYQERCIFDVEKQFDKYDTTPQLRAELIEELLSEKYIDELRFAQSVTRGKFNFRNWGKNKIRQYLQIRRIDKHDIEKALQEIPYTKYLATCQKLVDKKKEALLSKNLEEFERDQKVIATLSQKGYEFDVIKEAM